MQTDLRRGVRVAVAAAVLVGLAGCSTGTRQTLGLTRNSPDEFAVVAKAPLILPPDFGLRPPIPGAPPLAAVADPVAQATAALANAGRAPAAGAPAAAPAAAAPRANLTAGENAILGAAGVAVAEPGIRARVDLDAQQVADRGRTFAERLLWWQQPVTNTVLNPTTEADRLRAQGTTTTGAPPLAARPAGGPL